MARDPEKLRIAQHASYIRNKDEIRQRTIDRRLANKQWVDEYKNGAVCQCGEMCSICLEFHHLDHTTKELDIATAINYWSLTHIQHEITKCILLCANCHRKLHQLDIVRTSSKSECYLERRKSRADWSIELRKYFGCTLCQEANPYIIEYHHLDPTTKLRDIRSLIKRNSAWSKIFHEVKKCVLLCVNCHRKVHFHPEWTNRLNETHLIQIPMELLIIGELCIIS